jgi:hypothetical protein
MVLFFLVECNNIFTPDWFTRLNKPLACGVAVIKAKNLMII